MNYSLFICLVLISIVLVTVQGASKQTPVKERRRRSKEIEDKISKLDDSTKKRINAMKASGMPKSAIADKISYEAGGKNTAKRIVDALHDEPRGKKYVPPTKTAPKTATKPAPKAGTKATAAKTGPKTAPKAKAVPQGKMGGPGGNSKNTKSNTKKK